MWVTSVVASIRLGLFLLLPRAHAADRTCVQHVVVSVTLVARLYELSMGLRRQVVQLDCWIHFHGFNVGNLLTIMSD